MKNILIVITTGFVPYGGLTTVMMNYYRAMDKTGLTIDFASTNEAPKELLDELHNNGSEYFKLGNRKKNLVQYIWNLHRVLKQGRYDVVHVNGNSATMAIELLIAKQCGVAVRIAHGHNTRSSYQVLHKALSPFFRQAYTCAVAVSQQTGTWLFGSNYVVLNNAIDTNHYKFSSDARKKFRKTYGIAENVLVVGNVGKLNSQKNQGYLLKIFAEVKKRKEDSLLVIVGGGGLEEQLKQQAIGLEIAQSVIFLGMVDDVSDALNAMDVFVFPSIYEGLGLALIEAQASGLMCFASNVISKETKVSQFVEYMDLNLAPDDWGRAVVGVSTADRMEKSESAIKSIHVCGYDVSVEAKRLRTIYMK